MRAVAVFLDIPTWRSVEFAVHIDVVSTGTLVQVVARGCTKGVYATALRRVEGDLADSFHIFHYFRGVVEVDVVTAGIAVQVALLLFEVVAAVIGY
ncbi:MAG: hypothetical protein SPL78_00080 [Bacteroidales bacterium]|nr:hypothetical protein [Bacteroidales bacterium]